MRLALVQFDIAWEAPEQNFDRVSRLLSAAPPEPGSLLLLPEMYSTGFSMAVDRVAEDEAGPSATFLAGVARRYQSTVVGGRVTRGASGRGRNEALVFGPGGDRLATYVKMHPFSFAEEDLHYEAGAGPLLFSWGPLSVAPFICYDLRFPEVYRAATLLGAQVLVTIANWPEARASHWRQLLQARAVENLAFVASVNRIGVDPSSRYAGGSLVIDPRGEVVLDAGAEPGIYEVDLDVAAVARARSKFPALRDVRADFTAWAERFRSR